MQHWNLLNNHSHSPISKKQQQQRNTRKKKRSRTENQTSECQGGGACHTGLHRQDERGERLAVVRHAEIGEGEAQHRGARNEGRALAQHRDGPRHLPGARRHRTRRTRRRRQARNRSATPSHKSTCTCVKSTGTQQAPPHLSDVAQRH